MPHCIIEYSNDLAEKGDIATLIGVVHSAAARSGLFTTSDIKSRAISYQNSLLTETLESFIHVNLKILSGRTSGQKKQLSEAVLSAISELPLRSISISVEVTDIDRDSYSKVIR